jgi:hypothetical protein
MDSLHLQRRNAWQAVVRTRSRNSEGTTLREHLTACAMRRARENEFADACVSYTRHLPCQPHDESRSFENIYVRAHGLYGEGTGGYGIGFETTDPEHRTSRHCQRVPGDSDASSSNAALGSPPLGAGREPLQGRPEPRETGDRHGSSLVSDGIGF